MKSVTVRHGTKDLSRGTSAHSIWSKSASASSDDESLEVSPPTCDEARAAMEVLNRFVLTTDTHENELNLHCQYKTMIQTKTIKKHRRQMTLDRYLKGDRENDV